MTMLENLYALLQNGSTSAGNNIFPNVAPDSPARTYVVYQRIFSNSENVLSGNTGLVNTRVQLDMFSETALGVQALANQVDALMNGWAVQNVSLGSSDSFEEPVRLYRVTAEYSVWHT